MPIAPVLLASQSPRRRELLRQLGLCFDTFACDIDERPRAAESPFDYVRRMAISKLRTGQLHADHQCIVIGADTVVALGDRILGKPYDLAQAQEYLEALSGQEHSVLTAVSVGRAGSVVNAMSVTAVRFKVLSAAEIQAYLSAESVLDKAGAYAIQGRAAAFVVALSGSYSGVVGLPLFETAELLKQQGLDVFANSAAVTTIA